MKAFVDKNGNDIYPALPLKYKDKMFQTTLAEMAEPMPADDELDEWHEWSLKMGKGSAMLVRYLWKDAKVADRESAWELFRGFVGISFEKHYLAREGAFSYNPNSPNATIDGTGSKMSVLAELVITEGSWLRLGPGFFVYWLLTEADPEFVEYFL